ncbi:MAG: response regulator [Candidatus Auribacter fodinae]|jgi:CheY-like chemotaxis protein|uniref:Response regulator n=1 Tax=Candidatus Auribacter fodinae TaxID=2093366 RepID=A0A3A4R8M8_9BACT|nr:MAG: response regulator [Candidatus Auribacter fodinae]
MPEKRARNILLVEDNSDHAELVNIVLQSINLDHELFRVSNGEKALDFLFQRGDYTDKNLCPRPDVVLLDLRLPKIDGLEVLKYIRESEQLKDIPVVVVTSSAADRDRKQAESHNVHSYVLKPYFEHLSKILTEIGFVSHA